MIQLLSRTWMQCWCRQRRPLSSSLKLGLSKDSRCHVASETWEGDPGGLQEYRALQKRPCMCVRSLHKPTVVMNPNGRRLCFCAVCQVVYYQECCVVLYTRLKSLKGLLFAPGGHSCWTIRFRNVSSASRSFSSCCGSLKDTLSSKYNTLVNIQSRDDCFRRWSQMCRTSRQWRTRGGAGRWEARRRSVGR